MIFKINSYQKLNETPKAIIKNDVIKKVMLKELVLFLSKEHLQMA